MHVVCNWSEHYVAVIQKAHLHHQTKHQRGRIMDVPHHSSYLKNSETSECSVRSLSEFIQTPLVVLDLVPEPGELLLVDLSVVLHLFLQGSLWEPWEWCEPAQRFWRSIEVVVEEDKGNKKQVIPWSPRRLVVWPCAPSPCPSHPPLVLSLRTQRPSLH